MEQGIATLLMLSACLVASAQSTIFDTIGLSPKTFRKVLNEQFSTLITGQAKNSIGNFAALDTKDAELSFAGSHITKAGSALTLKASGGYSDGLFRIFTNSALNTKVSLDLQFNTLSLSKKVLEIENTSFETYMQKEKAVRDKSALRKLELQFHQDSTMLRFKLAELKSQLKKLKTRAALPDSAWVIDSIRFATAVVSKRIDSVQKALTSIVPLQRAEEIEDNRRSIELKALKPDFKIMGFSFGWFSVGYKITNNSFRLFNSKLALADQIQKGSYPTQEARFSYSHYRWSTAGSETRFLQLGTTFSYGDNLGNLTKTELTDVKNFTGVPGERTTTNKYFVYTGDYKKRTKAVGLFGDYYRFFFKDNVFALHFFPAVKFADFERPIYNAGLGTLFSFKKEKEETAVVNAELYYNFLDLFDYGDTDDKFFERNEIGIRFSFPITFKTKD